VGIRDVPGGRTRKTGPQADEARAALDHHAGMSRLSHRLDRRRDEATPILLPSFFIAMLAVVAAVVVVGRTGSDLADIGAVALLLLTAGLVLRAITRRLGEGPPQEGPGDREEGP
jgi:hypothetical protein